MLQKIKHRLKSSFLFSGYKGLVALKKKTASHLLWRRLTYYWAVCLNWILNPIARLYRRQYLVAHKDWQGIKRVILVHSLQHFDPNNDRPERDFYYSSTASIARNIWKLLEGKERFHIDIKKRPNFNVKKYARTLPPVDLIVGLMSEHFIDCCKAHPRARKIILSVNCHPLYRAKVLLDEATNLHKDLPVGEWIKPGIMNRLRFHADAIAQIGNQTITQTFKDQGLTEISIFPLNLGIMCDVVRPNPQSRPKDVVRFIYPATDMGIRKGFFRLVAAWERLMTLVEADSVELYVVGFESFPEELNVFTKRHRNVINLGWLSYTAQLPYLQSSHVVIGSSLEEGQVGWVLEAMATGAVPVITRQCGINLRNGIEGFIINDPTNAEEIVGYMKRLIEEKALREKMSAETLKVIDRAHRWEDFRIEFRKVIEA